ncbi:MAG: NAD-dependent epimerase/dehydratase family protein [bacterium]|nr:NAD-dependent epimerase/dehydratase family protein [bacterium]
MAVSQPRCLSITWVSGDVTDRDSLRGQFDGANWLIHAAGMLGQAGVPERAYFDLHMQGTTNVQPRPEAASVQHILDVSSPGVLGPINGPPADETAPLARSNPGERSKAAAEQVAQVYIRGGLPVVIARPEFVYGPGDRHVLGLFKAVRDGRFFTINGGSHTCHPTYIDDAVAGCCCAAKRRTGEIYHITGPQPVTFPRPGSNPCRRVGCRRPNGTCPSRWQ